MKTPSNQLATVGDFTGCLEQGEFDYGIVTLKGIALRDEVSEEKWLTLTQNVAAMYEATGIRHQQAAFMMGDLLRWGEERFGEKYAQVIDSTREYMRLHAKTLANWQWITGKIEPSRRRENLSLAHHESVAKLDAGEQTEFLQLAEDEGMTVKELRAAIRERHPSKPRATKDSVKTVDNEKSALQKLVDVSNFLSEKGAEFLDDDQTADKWKGPMEKLYKMYRRKWQTDNAKRPATARKKKGKK
jgi:hypothetical protein